MSSGRKKDKTGLLIFILATFLALILFFKLINLYISEGVINTNYRDPEIDTQYFRGTIYDRSGNILAMDRTTYIIEIEAERVSEVSRLSSIIAPYTYEDAVTLENMIRSNNRLSLKSNLLMAEADRFNELMKSERFDHLVSLSEKRERIYPIGEHGRLIIGRENDESSFSAEAMYDELLEPRLTLSEMSSSGEDITLSLSQRIQYVADHILRSYVSPESDEYLMLCLLDYKTGEIYALSSTSENERGIDFDALKMALSSGEYTILKTAEKKEMETPDDIRTRIDEREVSVIYSGDYAIVTSSSSAEALDGASKEFRTMLSL